MAMDDDEFKEDTLSMKLSQAALSKSEEAQRAFSLLVYHCGQPKVIPVNRDKDIILGRSETSDVTIEDQTISKKHVRFSLIENEVWVEDLNSTNGTFINGKNINRCLISPGSEVKIGRATIVLYSMGLQDSPLHRVVPHEHFMDILNQEVSRAQSLNRSLITMVVQSGLHERRHVTMWLGIVRKLLRPIDHTGIYSADTLEIVLPEFTKEQAALLAQKIIHHPELEGSPFYCGISIFPLTANSTQDLILGCLTAVGVASEKNPVQIQHCGENFTWVRPSQGKEKSPKSIIQYGEAMNSIIEMIEKLGDTQIPIMIQGEPGTGKEILAHEIHLRSSRREKRMCCVNCESLPDNLAESILFGHVRGGFPGAHEDNVGVFSQNNGGILYLQAIHTLAYPAQSALLRFLKSNTITPMGSTQEQSIDLRIITSANNNLESFCANNRFRQDLLSRLSAITIRVPPLRNRPEEIETFAYYFLKELNQHSGTKVDKIAKDAMDCLYSYSWPGNLLELRNVIVRAAVVCEGKEITIESLPIKVTDRFNITNEGKKNVTIRIPVENK